MKAEKKAVSKTSAKVGTRAKRTVRPKIEEVIVLEEEVTESEEKEEKQSLLSAEEKQEIKGRLYANRKENQNDTSNLTHPKGDLNNKMYLSLETRILLLAALLIVFLGLGAFSISKALDNTTTYGFYFNENSSLEYKVCLQENDYFIEKCLDHEVTHYVANLIDYIEAEFKYNFDASALINYEYSYYITARLLATEKNSPDSIIKDEVEYLTEKKTVEMEESSGFLINEKLIIDYKRYNNIMTNFRRDYALLFDSSIVIELHVELEGNNDRIRDDISSEQTMSMVIPLSEQTINVEVDYDGINNHEVIESKRDNLVITGLFYILALLSFLVVVDVLLKIYKLLAKVMFNKSDYKKALDKIMRDYGQVIVETNTMPDIPQEGLHKITNFEELLDLHTVLQKPILYMKIHHEKACFMIHDGDDHYQYIMKAADLEDNKK